MQSKADRRSELRMQFMNRGRVFMHVVRDNREQHTPTIVPEPSFPGWMRRSHTAQMMRKCPLYAPIQITSRADCRLDPLPKILQSHD